MLKIKAIRTTFSIHKILFAKDEASKTENSI